MLEGNSWLSRIEAIEIGSLAGRLQKIPRTLSGKYLKSLSNPKTTDSAVVRGRTDRSKLRRIANETLFG